MQYKSVEIDSKTIVFTRAHPGKKETIDGLGSNSIFEGSVHFPKLITHRLITVNTRNSHGDVLLSAVGVVSVVRRMYL